MPLKSVVLAPPPGTGPPRRTVVLRPGAPRDKGRLADLLAALFGVLLLLLAIVLVSFLPDKEYALPQFRVTFPDAPHDSPTQAFQFAEGSDAERIHVFSYELPDNVQSITIVAEFLDNETSSLPDQFRIELFDPAGNPIGVRKDLTSPAPIDRSNPGNASCEFPCFEMPQVSDRTVVAVAEHPAEQIVSGLAHTEVKEQVLARLAPQYHIPTAGVWTIRVTLVSAGDCPEASDPDVNALQAFDCIAENDGQTDDPGNRFAVAQFVYTTTAPCVEQLGVEGFPACAT